MRAIVMLMLALAGDAMASDGARLYASCAGCHGTAGAGSGQALPVLAGQPKEALVASMRAFKGGTRTATIMQQIAKGYSDEEIALIAAYLAAQKPKSGGKAPGSAPPFSAVQAYEEWRNALRFSALRKHL